MSRCLRVPAQPPRGRHRTEPHQRQLRGPLRPVVESRRGGAGNRPDPPHRPDQDRQRLQAHCARLRKKSGTSSRASARPSRMSSANKASPRASPRTTSSSCSAKNRSNDQASGKKLSDRDSNPDEQIQSLSCYRYTIGQGYGYHVE